MKRNRVVVVELATLDVVAHLKSHLSRQVAWPVAGLALGVLAALSPGKSPISLQAGMAALGIDMLLVLILSRHPVGARLGVLIAGVFLAVPCFVRTTPLALGMLACLMCVPFVAGADFLLVREVTGFRRRVAHMFAYFGALQASRRPRRFEAAALFQWIAATVVLAVAIAVVKAVSGFGDWRLAVRWFAGGIGFFALAEMGTACHDFLTALAGVRAPAIMRSPYRAASLIEFWNKRWNVPASAMFRAWCYAPLCRHNMTLALFAAFAMSALGHVLLPYLVLGRWGISLICGAFFLVQPVLILVERQLNVRRWPIVAARVWTLGALAITSPMIMEPILQVIEPSWGGPDSVLLPTLCAVAFVIVLCGIVSLASLVSSEDTSLGPTKNVLHARSHRP